MPVAEVLLLGLRLTVNLKFTGKLGCQCAIDHWHFGCQPPKPIVDGSSSQCRSIPMALGLPPLGMPVPQVPSLQVRGVNYHAGPWGVTAVTVSSY